MPSLVGALGFTDDHGGDRQQGDRRDRVRGPADDPEQDRQGDVLGRSGEPGGEGRRAAANARTGTFGGKLMKLSASIFCSHADANRDAPIRLARCTTWNSHNTHPP